MPITLYQQTSAFKAGAIKATTNSILSCTPKFKDESFVTYYTTSSAFPLLSGNSLIRNIYPKPHSFFVGLSSNNFSSLTSINITPTTRVFVNNKTGVVYLSSQTPGTYRFNYFAQASAIGSPTILLSASVPVVFLSGAPLITPNWNLPYRLTIFSGNPQGTLKSNNLFTLAYYLSSYTEFNEIIAQYNTRWAEYAWVLSRGFNESAYKWKYILKNRNYTNER